MVGLFPDLVHSKSFSAPGCPCLVIFDLEIGEQSPDISHTGLTDRSSEIVKDK